MSDRMYFNPNLSINIINMRLNLFDEKRSNKFNVVMKSKMFQSHKHESSYRNYFYI